MQRNKIANSEIYEANDTAARRLNNIFVRASVVVVSAAQNEFYCQSV